MRIALIDYGAGNLTSVRKALSHLGASFETPAVPEDLSHMDGVIVPGVGNFKATAALNNSGWRTAIRATINRECPFLGICLGLHWLFEGSEEAPDVPGLGLIEGHCRLIHENDDRVVNLERTNALKVPHVGWNNLHHTRKSWVLDGIREGDQVYFTHSYAAPTNKDCAGSTTYGIEFASAIERDHIAAVQFHPEKSGDVGLQILTNFLNRVV